MIKSVKGKLVAALSAIFVVACLCFGISTISNKSSAYAAPAEIELTYARYDYQNNLTRYLIYLDTDQTSLADEYWENNTAKLISADGTQKDIHPNIAISGTQLMLLINYSDLEEGVTEADNIGGPYVVYFAAGTKIGNAQTCVLKNDVAICINGGVVKGLTSIDYVKTGGGIQENNSRYIVQFSGAPSAWTDYGTIPVKIDGAAKSLEFVALGDGGEFAALLPFTVCAKDTAHTIEFFPVTTTKNPAYFFKNNLTLYIIKNTNEITDGLQKGIALEGATVKMGGEYTNAYYAFDGSWTDAGWFVNNKETDGDIYVKYNIESESRTAGGVYGATRLISADPTAQWAVTHGIIDFFANGTDYTWKKGYTNSDEITLHYNAATHRRTANGNMVWGYPFTETASIKYTDEGGNAGVTTAYEATDATGDAKWFGVAWGGGKYALKATMQIYDADYNDLGIKWSTPSSTVSSELVGKIGETIYFVSSYKYTCAVSVTTKSGKEVAVTKGENGVYSFTMPSEEVTISCVDGSVNYDSFTNQESESRYIMILNGGEGDGTFGKIGDVKIKVDGEEKTAVYQNWVHTNDDESTENKLAFVIPYDVLPATGYHTLEIEEQTLTDGRVFMGVSRIVCDGVAYSETITKKTLERVGGIYHGDNKRYQVYLTDFGGAAYSKIGDVAVEVLNTATSSKETKTAEFYNWKNDGDGSNDPVSMLMFGASDYPLENEYKITVKAGKVGNYYIENEVSFYIYNGLSSDKRLKEEVKITSMVGAAQDYDNDETDEHLHRYLIYLNFDKEINYNAAYELLGDITVTINGEEKVVGVVADELANKRAFLVVNYTDAPKDQKNEITIKAGTGFSSYVITEDFTIRTDGDRVYTKLTEMNIEWGKEEKDDKTVLKGGVQENLKRYLFYIQTDVTGLTDTMWEGNECVIDAGTDNERYAKIYYVGGCFEEDDTSIMVILNFNDIVEGARSSSEIGVHSVTIKAGTVLNGKDGECYGVKNDLTLWVGGSYIAENEEDIPALPDGVFYVNQGIDNKTLDYTATKIEDYIGEASVVKLRADAKKLTDNNVFFEMPAYKDYKKSIRIVGSNAEPKIKFRSVYTGEQDGVYEDIYLLLELRSQIDYGSDWGVGNPLVRLRYSGFLAETGENNECLWFDFFPNGWTGTPQYATFMTKDFKLEAGEYYVEFGAVNTTDSQGREGFVFFVNVIQGDKQAYAECTMTGDYNVSDTGDVVIYQSPYTTGLIDGWDKKKNPDYNGYVSSYTLMSVDKTRVIDGETVEIGLMSFYNPKIRVADKYDEYDVSDIVPIGTGKTYTKIEGDTTSASQSMINATKVSANNGGYVVRMKIKFTGDDFGCTFAFRGKNTHANSGYKVIIAEDVVIIGSTSITSPFRSGETYEIEIGCIDFYIADEVTTAGTQVYLKVNGETVVEDIIDKITDLGTYFCGLVEGAGDSTVTITSAKDGATQPVVTIASSRMEVAAGKRTTLSYTSSMPTAFDSVEYEIVKGDAEMKDGALYSNTDGEIVVRAKVTNEFGTFYSEEIILNEGQGSGCSCGSSVDGAIFALPLIAVAAIIMIFKKRREIK